MYKTLVMMDDKQSKELICWKEYHNLIEAVKYCKSVSKLKEVFAECQQVK